MITFSSTSIGKFLNESPSNYIIRDDALADGNHYAEVE